MDYLVAGVEPLLLLVHGGEVAVACLEAGAVGVEDEVVEVVGGYSYEGAVGEARDVGGDVLLCHGEWGVVC